MILDFVLFTRLDMELLNYEGSQFTWLRGGMK